MKEKKLIPIVVAALLTSCMTPAQQQAQDQQIRELARFMVATGQAPPYNSTPTSIPIPQNEPVQWVPGHSPQDSDMFRPGSAYNPINVNVVPNGY
jgi:hypothetical protein